MSTSFDRLGKPIISAVVAMAENRVMGINNQLPWHLPADLKHFKSLTTGHIIVMGRKTFESIGRPLPHRTNIILTRHATYDAPGCRVATSVDEVLKQVEGSEEKEIFIIGGAEIYSQFMPYIEKIYLTIIHHYFMGDTYFPSLDPNKWKEIAREDHLADKENAYAYSFVVLQNMFHHEEEAGQRTL